MATTWTVAQLGQFPQRLIHEHAAAVHRRADRIGRDEQHAQSRRPARGSHRASKRSRKYPPSGRRNASVSSTTASLRARQREPIAPGKLPERAPPAAQIRRGRARRRNHAEQRAAIAEEEMRRQPPPIMDILPAEQQEILLQHRLDLRFAEALADGAAMLVIHHAARLIQHLPAALPRQVAEVGVFQIEGREQFVEAAQLQEFPPVEGAGSAAAVEAGKQTVDGRVDAMPHAQAAILPPALRQAGFFAQLGRVAKEDLAGDGEDAFVA